MNPLIVVFLKWPEPGKVKTRLAKTVGDDRAASIYRALVRELGRILTSCTREDLAVCYSPASQVQAIQTWLRDDGFTHCPIAHWWAQPESDLGERQAWAVDQAFARGYNQVALIGTDCIDLNRALFQQTWIALEKSDWVFGPAKDGGYYLGATKPASPSPRDLFQGVRWSSQHTLSDCLANLESRQGSAKILETLKDIDDYEDWISIEDRLPV